MRLRVPFLLLTLAACQPAPAEHAGATLRVDVVGVTAARRVLTGATQAGLTDIDGAGRTVPGLASSWRIAGDGRDFIFRLRPAVWADGRAVKASDVVAVFRRLIARSSSNALRPALGAIDGAAAIAAGRAPPSSIGVTAPIESVVEIRLDAPDPALLTLLAQPELAVVRSGPRPPALGAFSSGEPGATVELTRNPRFYAADTVALARITLASADDPGTAVARFARDRTDLVLGGGLAGLSDARLLGGQVLHVEPSWGVYGYLANVRSGPLADVRVRRALAMTVTRDDLAARLFGVPAMVPVSGMLPPGLSVAAGALPDWAMLAPLARLDAARALLAAAGFDAAHPLALTVTIPSGREHAAVLAAVAADWARLGIVVTARELSAAAFETALRERDFALAVSEQIAPVDTAIGFVAPFRCGNAGGYCNAEVDTLLDSAATDPAALARAETLLLADAPLIPLFRPVRWALVSVRVTGWIDNVAGAHPLARLGISPGRTRR